MSGSLPTIYRLKSPIRDYRWGILNGISHLFSWPSSNGPEAELWMGAHPSAPSPLEQPAGDNTDLLQLILSDPEAHLGADVTERFENLPYLFKVLAAAEPLSLQVHPTTSQAQAGFAKEEKAQVPLNAPSRMYKDQQHKPELIVSLTPFQALVGFLPAEDMLNNLMLFGFREKDSVLKPWIDKLCLEASPMNLRSLVEQIFVLDSKQITELLYQAVSRAQSLVLAHEQEGEAPISVRLTTAAQGKKATALKRALNLRRLAQKYPGDAGVVMSLLLRLVELKPGEALFLSAGKLHAYVEGIGLEIMANSDNVLRGGMTPKYVNIAELMNSLDFSSDQGAVITGDEDCGLRRYRPPVDEFELDLIELKSGRAWRAQGPDILLMLEGEGSVQSQTPASEVLSLKRGDQVFCSAEAPYVLNGRGLLARASIGCLSNKSTSGTIVQI